MNKMQIEISYLDNDMARPLYQCSDGFYQTTKTDRDENLLFIVVGTDVIQLNVNRFTSLIKTERAKASRKVLPFYGTIKILKKDKE